MHILISGLDSGGLGGAENFIQSLVSALRKKGVKTSFLSCRGSLFTRNLKKIGFKIFQTPVRMDLIGDWKGVLKFFLFFPVDLAWNLAVLRKFKKSGGNILILTGLTDKIILTALAKLLKIKTVWLTFAPEKTVLNKNLGLPGLLYSFVRNKADLKIVPTHYAQKFYPEAKIIPCGINLVSFKKKPKTTKKTIGLLSRIEPGKGQDVLIEIARLLPEVEVLIVGEGDISGFKPLRNVRFLGFRQDKFSVMSKFDVFVFPSSWPLEGFGLVLLEAMMLGIPIVASNFGPIPEVVGDAGILVKPEAKTMAKEIKKLLADKQNQKELIAKGLKRVKMFDINKIADQYYEILKNYCSE